MGSGTPFSKLMDTQKPMEPIQTMPLFIFSIFFQVLRFSPISTISWISATSFGKITANLRISKAYITCVILSIRFFEDSSATLVRIRQTARLLRISTLFTGHIARTRKKQPKFWNNHQFQGTQIDRTSKSDTFEGKSATIEYFTRTM